VDLRISVPRGAARDQAPDAIDPASPAFQHYVGGQKLYLGACAPERQADIVIDYNDLKAPEAVKWTVPGA
jgi:uridine kinase